MEKQAYLRPRLRVFGENLTGYERNRVLLDTLHEIFEVETIELSKTFGGKVRFFFDLLKKRKSADAILLMYPAYEYTLALFAARPFLRARVIVDAFISIYDSYVFDRELASPNSLKSAYYFLLDWLSTHTADILLFDTEDHRDYFINTFGAKKKTSSLIFPISLGLEKMRLASSNRMEKSIMPQGKFNIFFFGNYIPLQGIEYIVKAAHILRDQPEIHFTLVGSGQTRKEIDRLAEELGVKNISFLPKMPHADLMREIPNADVSLGIFGNTNKAKRVIPNKLVESLGAGAVCVTGRNSASERYFADGKDLFYSSLANEKDLAAALLKVYKKRGTLDFMKKNAMRKIEMNFSKESLREHIIKELLPLL